MDLDITNDQISAKEGGSRRGSFAYTTNSTASNTGTSSGKVFRIISKIMCEFSRLCRTLFDGFGGIMGDFRSMPYADVCFVAGTPVQTKNGTTAIEDIREGDMVWAWDEETGEVALKEVVETYVNQSNELIHVYVNGEEIVTTPTHPFYSPVKGWTAAAKLRAGDILVLLNGEYVVVEKVQHEILETPITVYNFQVEGFHTYYVSDIAVLVHNSCSTPNTTTEWDIHYNSKGQVKVGDSTAQYDGRYYWLKDNAGHGGSAYKVYEKHGKYLYWAYDADRYGNFIYGKHKSDSGIILYIG